MDTSITQFGSEPPFPDFLPSVCDADLHDRIASLRKVARPVTLGCSLIDPLLLKKIDHVLPQLVSKPKEGDLSVRGCIDEPQRTQVLELARTVVEGREFESLPLAERRLEERRYGDYLKRFVRRKADKARLKPWMGDDDAARLEFRDWWARKEEQRQTAPLRKANRLANCRVTGRRLDCGLHPEDHRYFELFNCGVRYCRYCGPGIFADLFAKYIALWRIAERLVVCPGFRATNFIGTLDFTAVNIDRMPLPKEIQEFNEDIRSCVKRVTAKLGISSRKYLLLWCDEFGGWDQEKGRFNTNLHAHGVYVGPYLPYDLLLETWIALRKSRDGARGVFIKRQRLDHSPCELLARERARFARALGHALKYTGKHLSRADGVRLAQLEAAFHGVRRVHTMGLAYNADLTCHESCSVCGEACERFYEHQGDHSCKNHRSGSDRCPLCLGPLMFHRLSGYTPISVLKGEGRRNLNQTRQQTDRARVFAGPRGSPP